MVPIRNIGKVLLEVIVASFAAINKELGQLTVSFLMITSVGMAFDF